MNAATPGRTTPDNGRLPPGGVHADRLEPGHPDRAGADILVFAVMAVVGWHVLSLPFNLDSIGEGILRGPDDYTRMARVRDLLANGWFGPVLDRVGNGELLHHWTRPMDAVIAGLYYLLALMLPAGYALHWAGAAASPLVQLLSVIATIAVLRSRLSADTLMTLILVLMLMPVFYVQFRLGRPDHHGLQIGLMSVLLALMLRIVLDTEQVRRPHRWAWGAGGVAALLTWSVPGGLLPVIAVFGALGMLWVLRGGAYADAGLHAAAAAVVAVLAVLPLERGGAFAVLDPDRLSLIHVFILAFAAAAFGGARVLESALTSGSLRRHACTALRWGFAVLVAISGLVLLAALIPTLLFAGHVVELDEFYRQTRSGLIVESRSIFAVSTAPPTELYRSIAKLAQLAALLLVAPIAFAVALVGRPASWPYLLPPAAVIAAYVAFYYNNHFGLVYKNAAYMSVPVIFVYAGLVGDAAARLRRTVHSGGMLVALGTKFAAAGWPLGLMVPFAFLAANGAGMDGRPGACGLHQVQAELDTLAAETRADARVMAAPEISSELLYRTEFRVLSVPTHRYQPGFRVMHTIFSESDPARARALMREHGIAGVVTCTRLDGYFGKGEAHLHGRLARGEAPAGFERLSGPDSLVQVYLGSSGTAEPQQ